MAGDKRVTMTRPHGYAALQEEFGPPKEADTHMCPHCGLPWWVQSGSKKPHTFCGKCRAWTCSKPRCLGHCYPYEQQMDDVEAGKHDGRLLEEGCLLPADRPQASGSQIIVP